MYHSVATAATTTTGTTVYHSVAVRHHSVAAAAAVRHDVLCGAADGGKAALVYTGARQGGDAAALVFLVALAPAPGVQGVVYRPWGGLSDGTGEAVGTEGGGCGGRLRGLCEEVVGTLWGGCWVYVGRLWGL